MLGILTALCLCASLATVNGWGATYYVDQTGGNDSNLGTSTDNAWKTIAKVNGSSFFAGDSILFKKGETWREQMTITSSGSAGNVITFGAYGNGANPIISGANLTTSSWTQHVTNVWEMTYTPAQVIVIIDGTL
ncbi:MAG: hypothetical protein ACXW4G_08020, partial [Candidatus Deferrimicrobiaceae bacterium]